MGVLAIYKLTPSPDNKCETVRALGEMELLPAITLIVTLDKAADEWLKKLGESIPGNILFDGDGDPGHNCKTAPLRKIILGKQYFEMSGSGTILTNFLAISIRQRTRLYDKNFHYTVNAHSARHKHPHNALLCNVPISRVNDIMNGKHTVRVHCSKLPSQ